MLEVMPIAICKDSQYNPFGAIRCSTKYQTVNCLKRQLSIIFILHRIRLRELLSLQQREFLDADERKSNGH
jgi:hypothetical protein